MNNDKKPSIRIEEIRSSLLSKHNIKTDVKGVTFIMSALIKYLDEQWEKERNQK